MNERIRELYEQAHERKPVMVVDPQTGNPIQAGWANKPMYHNEFNPEKFAELIVKECVDLANKEAEHLEDEFERGRADDLRRWARVMNQHFGVEDTPVNDVDRILSTVRTRG